MLVVAAWRAVVLSRHGEPVGVDVGNWLSLGHRLFGEDLARTGAVYPPVIPFVTVVSAPILGLAGTAHLLAGMTASLAGAGVWWATRRSIGDLAGGAAGLLVALAGATSAAAAWGGYPQLVGLAAVAPAVVAAVRMVHLPSRRLAVIAGAWLAVVGATSHLVFGLALMACAVAVLTASLVERSWGWGRVAGWAALPLVPLAPLYVVMLARIEPPAYRLTGSRSLHDTLRTVGAGTPLLWLAVGGLAAASPLMTWRRRHDVLWPATTGLVLAAAIGVAVPEQRFAFLVPTAAAVGAAWALSSLRSEVVRAAAMGLLVAGVLVPAQAELVRQRDYYARFVPSGTGSAVAALRRLSAPRQEVAVAPVVGVPTGWVVQGWAQRTALVGGLLDWFYFPRERERAEAANDIFTSAPWPQESNFARARAAGVELLYIPTGWGGVDQRALRDAAARHPGLVAYDGPGALILRVPTS